MKGIPFRVPNITPLAYAPGPQPNSPGNSVQLTTASPYTVKPWPGPVPVLRVLASSPGVARMRGVIPVNDQIGPAPSNYLFIGGFVGKSKG